MIYKIRHCNSSQNLFLGHQKLMLFQNSKFIFRVFSKNYHKDTIPAFRVADN